MKQFVWLAKTLLIIFISLSLCCSSTVRKQAELKSKVLTIEQARQIVENGISVRFANENGFFPDCRMLGWTEEGFILDWGGRIDTAEYELFEPEIKISTGRSNSDSGAKLGLAVGIGLAALNLAYGIDEYNHDKSDVSGVILVYLVLSTPLLIGISAGLGAWSGSKTTKYKTYKFDYLEFQDDPWQLTR